jgi:hypothetical protein
MLSQCAVERGAIIFVESGSNIAVKSAANSMPNNTSREGRREEKCQKQKKKKFKKK